MGPHRASFLKAPQSLILKTLQDLLFTPILKFNQQMEIEMKETKGQGSQTRPWTPDEAREGQGGQGMPGNAGDGPQGPYKALGGLIRPLASL